MNFHGEPIYTGDRVFDISVNRGYGKVIKVEETYFQVKFEKFSVNFSGAGVQQGKDTCTLYWDKPLIIKPVKNDIKTAQRTALVYEFIDTVSRYKEFL